MSSITLFLVINLLPRHVALTYFRVHLPQVVHDAVEVEFACTQNHVFARLLHLGGHQRVALVNLPQAVQHLGQL